MLFEHDSLRRQLEGPGKKQRQRQAENDEYNEDFEDPIGGAEVLDCEFGDLGEQPADDDVGYAHAYHVPSFQFGEE